MGVTYNSSIIRNGLVLQVDASNIKSYSGSGTSLTDISGSAIAVTLQNSGSSTVTVGNGYITFAPPDMTGTAGYYLVNDSIISSLTRTLTIETCVYISSFYANFARPISPRTSETSSPLGFSIGYNNITWEANTGDGWFTGGATDTRLVAAQWLYVSQTLDDYSKTIVTYLNGTQIGSTMSYTGVPNSGGGVLLGRGFYGGVNNFNGRISFLRYYSRSLSPTEIYTNFSHSRSRYNI